MATNEDQIAAMRDMCEKLPRNAAIKSAYVDDWGRFGNFQIIVKPTAHHRGTTNQIKALVKKALPEGAHLRQIFGPDPIRDYNPWTRKTKTVGYKRDFWVVDIDYQAYLPEINRFGNFHADNPDPGPICQV